MIKHISTALLLFTCSLIFSQETGKIKGDREVVSLTQVLDQNFKALKVSGAISVILTSGGQNKYTLTADQNLQDIVDFTVDKEVLSITTSAEITRNKRLEVELTVKDLESITLKDDASLKTAKKMNLDKMRIEADNSSKFDIALDAKVLQIRLYEKASGKITAKVKDLQIEMNDRTDLRGRLNVNTLLVSIDDRSDLNLTGKSGNSSFKLKSSAKIDAKKLKSIAAEIEASNTAEISLRVSRKLGIKATDKSKVIVYGNPDIQLKGFTDKARVIKK